MSERARLPRPPEWLLFTLLLLATFAANAWVIDPRNGFLFDDYDWLARLRFVPFESLGTLFPVQPYNDRPVGALVIKILFTLFELDPKPYHLALLGLHLANTTLVYFICKRLAVLAHGESERDFAIVTAALFGMWPRSLMAVQWCAAIFDLFGTTLSLLVALLYLQAREERRYRIFRSLLAATLFWGALRTKEMTVVVPVLLLLLEVAIAPAPGRLRQALRARPLLWLLLGLAAAYVTLIGLLMRKGMVILEQPTSAYYISHQPAVWTKNLAKYLVLYLDLSRTEFNFLGMGPLQYGLLGLSLLGFLASLILAVRGRRVIPLALVAAMVVSLGPVLPLANLQHVLYLYLPSMFVAMLGSLGLQAIARGVGAWRARAGLVPAVLLVLLLLPQLPKVRGYRAWWLALSAADHAGLASLTRMLPPARGATIFVPNARTGYNLFSNGPGNVNQLVFGDPTLVTRFDRPRADQPPPFVVFDLLDDGTVRELARSGERALPPTAQSPTEIVEVLPNTTRASAPFNVQPNGVSAISVRCRSAHRDAVLYWDEVRLETTYRGAELLTAFVPDALIASAGVHRITIRGDAGDTSDAARFEVSAH